MSHQAADILQYDLQRGICAAAGFPCRCQLFADILLIKAAATDKGGVTLAGEHIIAGNILCRNVAVAPGTSGLLPVISYLPDHIDLMMQLLTTAVVHQAKTLIQGFHNIDLKFLVHCRRNS